MKSEYRAYTHNAARGSWQLLAKADTLAKCKKAVAPFAKGLLVRIYKFPEHEMVVTLKGTL